MLVLDNLKLATLPLAVTVAGSVGTAATTVDIVSSFNITYTGVANGVVTVPNPTDTQAGDTVKVANVGTVAFIIGGDALLPGFFTNLHWNGTAWLSSDGGRNSGMPVTVATIPAGILNVTHNLGMAVGAFSDVQVSVLNSAGNVVIYRRNTAGDTANVLSFNVPVAVTSNLPHRFIFTPLS
jgi:hypothetical protein